MLVGAAVFGVAALLGLRSRQDVDGESAGKGGKRRGGSARTAPSRKAPSRSELRKGANKVATEDDDEDEEESEEEESEEEESEEEEEEEEEKPTKKEKSKSKKKAKAKAEEEEEEGGEEQASPTGGSAGDAAADGAPAAEKKSKKGGAAKGPKAYVTLPDGKLLSLRCPLGAEITNYAELSGALHDAISAQLESDGNAAMAGQMVSQRLEIEFLASLQSAPEAVSDASCDLEVIRAAKAVKVTLKSLLGPD